MSSQNILNYYGSKLDIKVSNSKGFYQVEDKINEIDLRIDVSEQYEVYLDKSDYLDLIVDYSEIYDVQLDVSDNVLLPIIPKSVDFPKTNYTIQTIDGYVLTTQYGEFIQYQY